MNPPVLTLNLLNKFLELIVGYYDFKEIEDDALLELIKLIDMDEKLYHIEGKLIYKKRAWIECLDRKERRRKEEEVINNIRDLRLKTIRQLQYKLAEEFGLEHNNEQ